MICKFWAALSAVAVVTTVSACGDPPTELLGESYSAVNPRAGQRHFENRQPAANNRACATCHPSRSAFTLSPTQVEAIFQDNPNDPLFASIDADDLARDFTTLRTHALIRVILPLPANVRFANDASRRTIDVWRAIPSVFNVALTAPYLWDGRGATLEDQAVGAIHGHFEPHVILPRPIMEQIGVYQRTLFSSSAVADAAAAIAAGNPPSDPDPPLDALQQQGRATFDRFCRACHGGVALDTPNPAIFPSRFLDIFVAEDNRNALPVHTLIFTRADGSEVTVRSPDPGRALITGDASQANTFDVPGLRGISRTAPYFHDHSARDLEGVIGHYNRFFTDPRINRGAIPADAVPGLLAYLRAL